MQHDAQVIISGYAGTNVDFRASAGNGNDRATFRLATTPRFLDRQQGEWRDHETVWMTVKAWRTLAHNVSASIRRGEPVVVIGKLRAERWNGDDGHERRRDVLEATMVAHDLSRGTSAFRRNERPAERVDSSDRSQAVGGPDERGDDRVPAAV